MSYCSGYSNSHRKLISQATEKSEMSMLYTYNSSERHLWHKSWTSLSDSQCDSLPLVQIANTVLSLKIFDWEQWWIFWFVANQILVSKIVDLRSIICQIFNCAIADDLLLWRLAGRKFFFRKIKVGEKSGTCFYSNPEGSSSPLNRLIPRFSIQINNNEHQCVFMALTNSNTNYHI